MPGFPRPPFARLLLAAALAGPLAACELPDFMSFPPQGRGNRVDADELKQLVPGTSSRADATALLGSPTAKASFDENTWLYISQLTKPVIGGTNAVRDQEVVVLSFDDAGILRNVETRGMDAALPVNVVSRTTPSPGTEATILQQLLGNVGKFNPGSAAGGSGSSRGNTGNAVGLNSQ